MPVGFLRSLRSPENTRGLRRLRGFRRRLRKVKQVSGASCYPGPSAPACLLVCCLAGEPEACWWRLASGAALGLQPASCSFAEAAAGCGRCRWTSLDSLWPRFKPRASLGFSSSSCCLASCCGCICCLQALGPSSAAEGAVPFTGKYPRSNVGLGRSCPPLGEVPHTLRYGEDCVLQVTLSFGQCLSLMHGSGRSSYACGRSEGPQ